MLTNRPIILHFNLGKTKRVTARAKATNDERERKYETERTRERGRKGRTERERERNGERARNEEEDNRTSRDDGSELPADLLLSMDSFE